MRLEVAEDVLTDLLRHAWLWQHHFSKEAAEIALDTVLSELRRLQEGERWKDVDEKMPTGNKKVLTHTPEIGLRILCPSDFQNHRLGVTKWRELPDATDIAGAGED